MIVLESVQAERPSMPRVYLRTNAGTRPACNARSEWAEHPTVAVCRKRKCDRNPTSNWPAGTYRPNPGRRRRCQSRKALAGCAPSRRLSRRRRLPAMLPEWSLHGDPEISEQGLHRRTTDPCRRGCVKSIRRVSGFDNTSAFRSVAASMRMTFCCSGGRSKKSLGI